MKFELKSFGYWSVIRVSFIVNLLLGLLIGVFFAVFVGLMFSFITSFTGMAGMPAFEEEMPPFLLLLILYPIMFGFGGAVFNTIIAVIGVFIYNMIGKFIGGLELEMTEMVLQPAVPAQQAARPPRQPPPPPPMQPLPPDMKPPDEKTDEGTSPPRSDESA